MAELLNQRYAGQPFQILAFPCNQFGGQEPGSNEDIKKFAADRVFSGILMDKIAVNGPKASPVYDFLKTKSGGTGPILWNFAKFMVSKDGTVHSRHGPKTSPSSLVPEIDELLK